MNKGQLRSAVKERLRLPAVGDPLLTDAVIDNCVVMALTDISEMDGASWPWLLTSAAVTFTNGVAAIPAAVVKLRELTIGTVPARAEHVTFTEYLDSAGLCVWTEYGASLLLGKTTPASIVSTLYYSRAEPAMATDADSPLLPATYHNVLVARASYHANVRRRFNEDMATDAGEYEVGVKRMITAAQARTGPRRIRHRDCSRAAFASW